MSRTSSTSLSLWTTFLVVALLVAQCGRRHIAYDCFLENDNLQLTTLFAFWVDGLQNRGLFCRLRAGQRLLQLHRVKRLTIQYHRLGCGWSPTTTISLRVGCCLRRLVRSQLASVVQVTVASLGDFVSTACLRRVWASLHGCSCHLIQKLHNSAAFVTSNNELTSPSKKTHCKPSRARNALKQLAHQMIYDHPSTMKSFANFASNQMLHELRV